MWSSNTLLKFTQYISMQNGLIESISDEDDVKHQEHMPYPSKDTGVKPEGRRLGMEELGCGQLSRRFYLQ